MRELRFNVFSRGTVALDLSKCRECESKACVQVCQTPGNGIILELDEDGLPRLKVAPEQVAKGGCVEDMGCLLACQVEGRDAIRFDLPMPELEAARRGLREGRLYEKEGEHGDPD